MMQTAELWYVVFLTFFFDQHSLYIQGLAYLNRWEDFITSLYEVGFTKKERGYFWISIFF